MAVGFEIPSHIIQIAGIRLAAISSGLYSNQRLDLALIEIAEGSVCSAVFTKNKFFAAPVQIARQHINLSEPRYCLINAGNANAGMGMIGIEDAQKACQSLADLSHCSIHQVLPFSTGVIGERLPIDKITNSLPGLVQKLSGDAWLDAAKSIMTTDTIPKVVSRKIHLGDSEINITGIAKGSGMIKPNMATMLSFVATDVKISQKLLAQLLQDAVNKSFNRISVDGDTSTNDACVLIATGKAHAEPLDNETDEYYRLFKQALDNVFCKLAEAIVKDGEGATKYIEIEISGGVDAQDCLAIAYQVASSPLVKTAFTASDPNWGRILAAVGNANVRHLEINKVQIYLDDLCIVKDGQCHAAYTEQAGKKIMLQKEIKISIQLGLGAKTETVWTTDLSHDYIKINASYRS